MVDLKILAEVNDFSVRIADKSLSCAVVGSSSTILEHELGDEIDSHDIVIRCNQAQITGYEPYVGSRISYRILNSHNFWITKPDWPSRQLMVDRHEHFDPDFLYKVRDETIIAKRDVPPNQFGKLLATMESNGSHVLFLQLPFHNFCDSLVGGKSASSGIVATLLAIKNFGTVTCYGFRFVEGEYNHYYETIKPYDQSCHQFDREKQLLEQLQKTNHINLK